jgi:hypothetical protein
MKNILIILGCIFSWFIYGVGLISPLTPSEGMPSVLELAAFFGLPILILIYCWIQSATLWAKTMMIIQGTVIIGFTGWLISIQI